MIYTVLKVSGARRWRFLFLNNLFSGRSIRSEHPDSGSIASDSSSSCEAVWHSSDVCPWLEQYDLQEYGSALQTSATRTDAEPLQLGG